MIEESKHSIQEYYEEQSELKGISTASVGHPTSKKKRNYPHHSHITIEKDVLDTTMVGESSLTPAITLEKDSASQ